MYHAPKAWHCYNYTGVSTMPVHKFNLLSVTPCMFFFLGRKTTVDQLRNQFLMAHMLPS